MKGNARLAPALIYREQVRHCTAIHLRLTHAHVVYSTHIVYSASSSSHEHTQLPLTEVDFLQQCLSQKDSRVRAKGVHKALKDDTYKFDPPKPKSKEDVEMEGLEDRLKKGKKDDKTTKEEEDAVRAYKYVRPGRFLDCVMAFSVEMEKRGGPVMAQRGKVQEIWIEARQALAQIAEYE